MHEALDYTRARWRAWHVRAPDLAEERERHALEKALLYAILAFLAVCLAAVVAYGQAHPRRPPYEAEQLPLDDIPLLTKRERIDAANSGVASYRWVDGVYYIDKTVPPSYWGGEGGPDGP